MFPTGDSAVGLGSGHLMLAPSVMATAATGGGLTFLLHATDAFPIAGDTHEGAHAMAMDMGETSTTAEAVAWECRPSGDAPAG